MRCISVKSVQFTDGKILKWRWGVGRYSRLARCESRATGRWTRRSEPRRAFIHVSSSSRARVSARRTLLRRYSTSVTIGHGAYSVPNVRTFDLCATWRVYICAVVVVIYKALTGDMLPAEHYKQLLQATIPKHRTEQVHNIYYNLCMGWFTLVFLFKNELILIPIFHMVILYSLRSIKYIQYIIS